MATHLVLYGRSQQLGALLEHLRRSQWFFGTIRGRRRIGKTALIQQALETMSGESSESGPWLLVEVPDSTPSPRLWTLPGGTEPASRRGF